MLQLVNLPTRSLLKRSPASSATYGHQLLHTIGKRQSKVHTTKCCSRTASTTVKTGIIENSDRHLPPSELLPSHLLGDLTAIPTVVNHITPMTAIPVIATDKNDVLYPGRKAVGPSTHRKNVKGELISTLWTKKEQKGKHKMKRKKLKMKSLWTNSARIHTPCKTVWSRWERPQRSAL